MSATTAGPELFPGRPPIVILAIGGSGTRVMARIVRHLGYFLGLNLNVSEDSLDIAAFLEGRINSYLPASGWIQRLLRGEGLPTQPEPDYQEMVMEFNNAVKRHRAGIPHADSKWGWKAPRSILMLPLIHKERPGLKVIHLIRDGRDIAYSTNHHQLNKHGQHVLSEDERQLPQPVQAMIYWARVNLACALYAEKYLGENYLLLRFEDLCLDPLSAVARVLDFLGCEPPSDAEYGILAEEVSPPASIGRWRGKPEAEVAVLRYAGANALSKFGYQ